jgi:hypothetical protein
MTRVGLFLVLAFAVGCQKAAPPAPDSKPPSPAAATAEKEHDHSHGDAPHGGTIADWGGGKYHVEFLVDHEKKEATVYVLGEDAKTAAPIKADSLTLSINEPAFQVELKAAPLEGEKEGASSRYVGVHDSLATVKAYAGSITGEVEGTPYAGDFEEK